jgi:hypothetical protein
MASLRMDVRPAPLHSAVVSASRRLRREAHHRRAGRAPILILCFIAIMKKPLIALLLSSFAVASFSQAASAPAQAASAPKHKLLKKLKSHKPAAPATDPENSPDKKGGN